MPDVDDQLATVTMQPARRAWWVWLIPLAAAVFVGVLVTQSVMRRGPMVVVTMTDGHGLRVGAPVLCRGIVVGEVERIALQPALTGVEAHVRLQPGAADLARGGSRFWVVRARFDLTGVGGLDTIVRPNYLAVIPGRGGAQSYFEALDDPPVIAEPDARGLEIVLLADQRGSVSAGAPVLYREAPVGRVTSVGLASDAGSVMVRLYIEPRYAVLVRDNSRFWNVSGTSWSLGLTGVRWRAQSLAAVLDGGVAFATPTEPGKAVTTGHTFTLEPEADAAYLKWRPSLPVGAALLPPDAPLPPMQRVTLTVPGKRFWNRTNKRSGWVLPTSRGMIGPRDLFTTDNGATLEVAGLSLVLANQPAAIAHDSRGGGLALLPVQDIADKTWSRRGGRIMTDAEPCAVFTGVADTPLAVDAIRLTADEHEPGVWHIDGSVPINDDLHGAAVLSRNDGALVGLLLVESGRAQVRPVPEFGR